MSSRIAQAGKIVLGCTIVAVAFGVLHDLFSAAVCVEYFTVKHPKIVESENWIVMALVWGFLATFWVGAGGGLWLAWCTQFGSRPALETKAVLVSVVKASLVLLVLAPLVWVAMYRFGLAVNARLEPPKKNSDLDLRLMASATMHLVSYQLAAIAFLWIGVRGAFLRYRKS